MIGDILFGMFMGALMFLPIMFMIFYWGGLAVMNFIGAHAVFFTVCILLWLTKVAIKKKRKDKKVAEERKIREEKHITPHYTAPTITQTIDVTPPPIKPMTEHPRLAPKEPRKDPPYVPRKVATIAPIRAKTRPRTTIHAAPSLKKENKIPKKETMGQAILDNKQQSVDFKAEKFYNPL